MNQSSTVQSWLRVSFVRYTRKKTSQSIERVELEQNSKQRNVRNSDYLEEVDVFGNYVLGLGLVLAVLHVHV